MQIPVLNRANARTRGVRPCSHVRMFACSCRIPASPLEAVLNRRIIACSGTRTTAVFARKTSLYLFSAKRYPKTPRQMPSPTSSRLTFETGAYSRVCKQTCPVSRAFSPPSADGSGIKSGFLLSCFSVFCRTARIPDSRIFRISFAADKERLRRRAPGTGVRKAQSFVPVQRGSAVAPAKTACGWFWVPFATKRYVFAF